MQTSSQKYETLGGRLRAERQRLGLTQSQMGEAGGVSKTTVLGYEANTYVPDVLYLSAVTAIGVDPVYILLAKRKEEFAAEVFSWSLARQLAELIEEWASSRGKDTPLAIRWDLLELFYRQFCSDGEVDGRAVESTLKLAS